MVEILHVLVMFGLPLLYLVWALLSTKANCLDRSFGVGTPVDPAWSASWEPSPVKLKVDKPGRVTANVFADFLEENDEPVAAAKLRRAFPMTKEGD